jgi:hypothetical protein
MSAPADNTVAWFEIGGMVVAYLTDPNGSMFALFSPKPGG